MQIDGNTILQPRQKLTSVPYAKRADVAKILMVVLSMPLNFQSMAVLSWIHPVRLSVNPPHNGLTFKIFQVIFQMVSITTVIL